jgi:hypothetical protein
MNKTNMRKVADAIEAETAAGDSFTFNIHHWVIPANTGCNTIACIGGTANLLELSEIGQEWGTITDIEGSAEKYLGLTPAQGVALFYPCFDYEKLPGYATDAFSYVNRNKKLVPDVLRYMAEKGKVDWIGGFEYARCVRNEKKVKEPA